MLAKDVNDNACFLSKRVVLGLFASKLAPTISPRNRTGPGTSAGACNGHIRVAGRMNL